MPLQEGRDGCFGLLLARGGRNALHHPWSGQSSDGFLERELASLADFALQVGMVALTGTTSRAHMEEDLRVHDFALAPEEVEAIESVLS